MLLKISISNKCCLLYFYKTIKQQKLFSALVIMRTTINNWAPIIIEHQISLLKIISYGSYDTEDWRNDAENSALPSQE